MPPRKKDVLFSTPSDAVKEAERAAELFGSKGNHFSWPKPEAIQEEKDRLKLFQVLQVLNMDGYIERLSVSISASNRMDISFSCRSKHCDKISQELMSAREPLKESSKSSECAGAEYDVSLPLITNPSTLLD